MVILCNWFSINVIEVKYFVGRGGGSGNFMGRGNFGGGGGNFGRGGNFGGRGKGLECLYRM